MGDVIDLRVYAVDVKNGTIAKISGSSYNGFINGETDLKIGLHNSVEMKENLFEPILKKKGIKANLIFLTTKGMIAVNESGVFDLADKEIKYNTADMYVAFDQYYQTRIEQGAHMHEERAIRR